MTDPDRRTGDGGHPDTSARQLRALLRREAHATGNEVLAGRQVSAERMEALERLTRLSQICTATTPRHKSRWPILAVLAGTLLVASLLLFRRVNETEIDLDVEVTEAGFSLAVPQRVVDSTALASLGVSGLAEIQLPRSRQGPARTVRASEGRGADISVSSGSDGPRQGRVALPALVLPAGTRVWVRATESPRAYRLSLNGARLSFRADVDGPVRIDLAGEPSEQLDAPSPRPILLQPRGDEVDFDLTLVDGRASAFVPQLQVTGLSFLRVDEVTDAERTVVRRVSTMQAGTLYFESINGERYVLRPGEWLRFDGSRGEIRTLALREDRVAMRFHGHVRGMSTGSAASPRSLMPTYLEWIRARHGVELLWGTTLYLFGLIVGVLRWWKGKL
jgi:hypothetical protein